MHTLLLLLMYQLLLGQLKFNTQFVYLKLVLLGMVLNRNSLIGSEYVVDTLLARFDVFLCPEIFVVKIFQKDKQISFNV
jgi:hypothetical protein